MFRNGLYLADLVSLEDWQNIQDYFAEALGITIRTFSLDSRPISRISRPNRICGDILPKIFKNTDPCHNCIPKDDIKSITSSAKDRYNFKLPFNLDLFVVPIKAVGDRVVAYVEMGPVILKSRRSVFDYKKKAERSEIDPEKLIDALIEINVFSYSKMKSITSLVREIFSYMAQTGYHKKRLGEIAPEVVEMDPLFARYYEEKILSGLLNSCTIALNADSGSVMAFDKNTKALHIKAAKKLDDKIVDSTNLKIGEGIAGLAAATSEAILLPQDENKNGLYKKMKRKYIKSSMIVPFNKGGSHDLYGVININMLRKNIDFSERDVALVKELVSLASVALIPFQPSAK